MRVHFAFQGAWNEAKVREGRGSAASFPGLAWPQFLITCSMEREYLHGREISHDVGWTHKVYKFCVDQFRVYWKKKKVYLSGTI